MQRVILLIVVLGCIEVSSQTPYIVSGIDTTFESYLGYYISRASKIDLLVETSSFTQPNTSGYILYSGDDSYDEATAFNLNGAVISGNYFKYTGSAGGGGIHSIIAGYSLDYKIQFNYFDGAFYGVVCEGGYDSGSPMVNTAYHIRSNVFRNVTSPLNESGYDNIKFYNNTMYFGLDYNSWLNKVSESNGTSVPATSKNIKIKNNIFYTVSCDRIISVAASCTQGFECDYNIYWCEESANHEMRFQFAGIVYSWDEWQALGFDTHSIIMNPNFIDFVNLVPAERIDLGTNLGDAFIAGISPAADWIVGEHPDTIFQDNVWQVGAYVLEGQIVGPDTQSPSIPKDLNLNSATETSFSFSWTASTDNVGVTGYNVYRDGVLLESTTEISYTDNTVSTCVDYSYTVSAFDAAGNESSQSEALIVNPCAPDVTPTITLSPNVANGITVFELIVRVTELNSVDTNGDIVVNIPKDQHWDLSEAYDPSLASLGGTSLNNNEWSYSENTDNHIFTSSSSILAGSNSTFGFRISFDPGSSTGMNPITTQLVSGGGGEVHVSNNSDSEQLDYFQ